MDLDSLRETALLESLFSSSLRNHLLPVACFGTESYLVTYSEKPTLPAAGNLQKSQSLKKTSGLSVIKCSHVLGSKPLETSTVLKYV